MTGGFEGQGGAFTALDTARDYQTVLSVPA
jgi:hypothetical protein